MQAQVSTRLNMQFSGHFRYAITVILPDWNLQICSYCRNRWDFARDS